MVIAGSCFSVGASAVITETADSYTGTYMNMIVSV